MERRDLSQAWDTAQSKQKNYYDRKAKVVFKVGDRVFLFKPSAKTGKAHKFARLFHGPFRVVETARNNTSIRPVDRPQAEPTLVSFDRLRTCPEGIDDVFWPNHRAVATCQNNPEDDTA